MKTKTLQVLAILLILEVGLVHYFTSQHEFEEAWILGYLFIVNFLGALLAAYGIYRQKVWGWGLGFAIATGSLVGYIWSRTTGLPGLNPEEWINPWGVMSLVTESLFCLLVFLRPWRAVPYSLGSALPSNLRRRYLFSAAGLIALVLVNIYTYRLDANFPQDDHGHVFFLWQVRLQPELSMNRFKEEYGMQVSRVAVTALNGIVDVRMKVLDSEKADQLLEDGHFALLVGDTLIPAPHIHRHMLKNKTIILFFPNLQDIVKSGTPVSVVFDNLRVEPVTAN